MLHPEARLAEMAERRRARLPKAEGWRVGWVWLLVLREADGTKHVSRHATYEEAKAARDVELETGLYEVAWMIWKQDVKSARR